MYTYTLQSEDTVSGKLTVRLHSEFANLQIPASPTIDTGETESTESVDESRPGVIEMANMDLSYIEDYSHYSAGFWKTVLAGKTEIELRLNDGYGDDYFFWGRVVDNIDEDEQSLIPGAERRTGVFTCASKLTALNDVTIDDLRTEAEGHDIQNSILIYFIKVRDIIASMLKLGMDQTFNTDDVEIEGDDFQYYGGSFIGLADVYVIRDGQGTTERGYLSAAGILNAFGNVWRERFVNCFDLLGAMYFWFGAVPRYRYDMATSRHKIQMIGRFTGFPTPITLEDPVSSKLTTEVDPQVKVLTSSRTQTGSGYIYGAYYNNKGLVGRGDPPVTVRPDLETSLDFITTQGVGPYWYGERLFLDPMADPFATGFVSHVRFWDVSTGAYSAIYQPSAEAHVRYWYSCFGPKASQYDRTYGSMKANDGTTNTQANLHVMSKTVIGTRTYYAAKVTKRLGDGSATVQWVEV
jgi:hypothetical protein